MAGRGAVRSVSPPPPQPGRDAVELQKETRRLRHRLRSMSQRLSQQRNLISEQRAALRDAHATVTSCQEQVKKKVRRVVPLLGLPC